MTAALDRFDRDFDSVFGKAERRHAPNLPPAHPAWAEDIRAIAKLRAMGDVGRKECILYCARRAKEIQDMWNAAYFAPVSSPAWWDMHRLNLTSGDCMLFTQWLWGLVAELRGDA